MSKDAQTRVSGQIRRWRLHQRTGHSIGELAREINPIVRGWMQYYGAFYLTALHPLLERVNELDALAPQEVSTAAGVPEGQGVLAADNPSVPEAFRPVGVVRRFLRIKMTRAR
jgi:hypothetical protein